MSQLVVSRVFASIGGKLWLIAICWVVGCSCEDQQSAAGPSAVVTPPNLEAPSGSSPRPLTSELVDATPTILPAAPLAAHSKAACPMDMQEVLGDYCPLALARCEQWLSRGQGRCARFAPASACRVPRQPKHYCMDRFEFPNQAGVLPVVMVNWFEAAAACVQVGKRLCTDSEWTFACEGEDQLAYPYGDSRDPAACNIDQIYRFPDFNAFDSPSRVGAEVERLDQRVASGALSCTSPFGIRDMTGNVDEWVSNESAKPYPSGLKGGYWGPIRARCRPMTTSHNQWFRFYQVGFRCCADPQVPSQPAAKGR